MWSDNETKTDLLGYQVHAELLKDVVLDPAMLPISIGVFGDWGSGKSSLMLLIKDAIEKWSKEEVNEKEKVLQISFNSWQFENYEDTKLTLIETVLTAIEEDLSERRNLIEKGLEYLKKIKYLKLGLHILKQLGRRFIPEEIQSLLPTAEEMKTDFIDDDAKILSEEVKNGNATRFIERFRQDFETIVDNVQYRSVIVYIDDLDRCEPDRIIQCLEAVKLFVNVKRTAFIIGADERIIEHAIDERYKHKIEKTTISSPYSDYMEKLIQLPYRIPRLSYSEQETYITLLLCSKMGEDKFKPLHQKYLNFRKIDKHTKYGIQEIRKDNEGLDFGDVERLLVIVPIMSKFLNGNPRQLKRFLNTFDMRMRMAKVAGFQDLRPDVLVKLMVLEYNSELRDNIDDLYSRQKEKGVICDIKEVEEQARNGKLLSSSWTSLWDKLYAIQWLASEPSLVNVDLRDYFWVSREALKNETPVENRVSNVARTAYNNLKKNQTIKAMKAKLPNELGRLTREEKDMIVLLLHQELVKDINASSVTRILDADEKGTIVNSLLLFKSLFEGIDTTKLPTSFGNFLKRMKSNNLYTDFINNMNLRDRLKNAIE